MPSPPAPPSSAASNSLVLPFPAEDSCASSLERTDPPNTTNPGAFLGYAILLNHFIAHDTHEWRYGYRAPDYFTTALGSRLFTKFPTREAAENYAKCDSVCTAYKTSIHAIYHHPTTIKCSDAELARLTTP